MAKWWKTLFKTKVDLGESPGTYSDERATLIYLIDVYSKSVLEVEHHAVDVTHANFDSFAKDLVSNRRDLQDVMFGLRKYFTNYRLAESGYVTKSYEEFKNLIWSFVEQMSDDLRSDKTGAHEVKSNLEQLKNSIQSDSLQTLRDKSRSFIETYAKHQAQQEARRSNNLVEFKKQLEVIKKRLLDADRSSHTDHLTQAFNRRSFDENIRRQSSWAHLHQQPVSILILDIDFFKRVNDTHGHDIGDFVLKEFARISHETFKNKSDYFARIGGEEFAVLLQGHTLEMAGRRAETILARVRREVFVVNETELKFTISIGAAQLLDGETYGSWFKRADQALYESKNSGRDRCTLAQPLSSQLRSA